MIGLQSIYHVEINFIRCIVITRKKCGIKETDTWAPQDVLLRERKNPLQVVDSIAELIVHEKKVRVVLRPISAHRGLGLRGGWAGLF